MFEAARMKLTAWYVVIIFLVSVLFSVAFYQLSTRELSRLTQRIERFEATTADSLLRPGMRNGPGPMADLPRLEELRDIQQRLLFRLVLINLVILAGTAAGGYFLAGKTLKPIQEMMQKQNTFISNASHELRTPLATLQAEMEAQLLEKKISHQDAKRLIQSNLEEVHSLKQLANGLLRTAEMNSSSVSQQLQKISLLAVVKAAEKKVRSPARKKAITIRREIEDATVLGMAADLISVFGILLENAIKYSPTGSEVHVSSKKTTRFIQIFVQDSGKGIAKKDLPYIFDRFYRADASRSETDGFGLGLSIARELLLANKGEITVSSRPRKGSTFIVTLPLGA